MSSQPPTQAPGRSASSAAGAPSASRVAPVAAPQSGSSSALASPQTHPGASIPLGDAPALSSLERQSGRILRAAAAGWLGIALLGQWAFAYYLLAFYGASALAGQFEAWERLQALGGVAYVAGDAPGNAAFGGHALAAALIASVGALQLIPQLRRAAPALHRASGRVFLLTVVGLTLSGFYLAWFRRPEPIPNFRSAVGASINGLLILGFSVLTLRSAISKKVANHRRWAMRLYLVSNAQWFLRIGVFAYSMAMSALGMERGGPFFSFWTFGCYLVPLAVLELVLRAGEARAPRLRLLAAGLVAVLAVLTALGAAGFAVFSQKLIRGEPLGF